MAGRGASNTTVEVHSHHWLIEEPNGTQSAAVCSGCKRVREFSNWLPQIDYLTRSERAEG